MYTFSIRDRLSEVLFNRIMSKRRRVVLNFQQRLDILEEINAGKRHADIAKKFGVGTSTVSDIKRSKQTILSFVSNLKNENQAAVIRTRKQPLNSLMDTEVYEWYIQYKQENLVPPSDQELSAKALEFNEKFGGPSDFKASHGWVRQFRTRNMITVEPKIQEPLDTPQNVTKQFKNFIKRDGYILDNIYSVSEMVFTWKSLPHYQNSESDSHYVTIVMCTNATGMHKIPLWVIGPEKKVKSAVNTSFCLYKYKKSACMNLSLFAKWFENVFKPEVKQRLQNIDKLDDKVLLLINDAPWHPGRDTLVNNDAQFDVKYIPKEFSSELHPMELGVQKFFRFMYKKKILERCVTHANAESFLANFKINDSISLLNEIWKSFSKMTLSKTWRKLLTAANNAINLQHCEDSDAIARKFAGRTYYDKDSIVQWLEVENDYLEYYSSKQESEVGISSESEAEDGFSGHYNAFQSLTKSVEWYKHQKECKTEELAVLEQVRELASTKIEYEIKQEHLESEEVFIKEEIFE